MMRLFSLLLALAFFFPISVLADDGPWQVGDVIGRKPTPRNKPSKIVELNGNINKSVDKILRKLFPHQWKEWEELGKSAEIASEIGDSNTVFEEHARYDAFFKKQKEQLIKDGRVFPTTVLGTEFLSDRPVKPTDLTLKWEDSRYLSPAKNRELFQKYGGKEFVKPAELGPKYGTSLNLEQEVNKLLKLVKSRAILGVAAGAAAVGAAVSGANAGEYLHPRSIQGQVPKKNPAPVVTSDQDSSSSTLEHDR